MIYSLAYGTLAVVRRAIGGFNDDVRIAPKLSPLLVMPGTRFSRAPRDVYFNDRSCLGHEVRLIKVQVRSGDRYLPHSGFLACTKLKGGVCAHPARLKVHPHRAGRWTHQAACRHNPISHVRGDIGIGKIIVTDSYGALRKHIVAVRANVVINEALNVDDCRSPGDALLIGIPEYRRTSRQDPYTA